MEILKISEDMAKVIYFSMMAVNTKVNLIKVNWLVMEFILHQQDKEQVDTGFMEIM